MRVQAMTCVFINSCVAGIYCTRMRTSCIARACHFPAPGLPYMFGHVRGYVCVVCSFSFLCFLFSPRFSVPFQTAAGEAQHGLLGHHDHRRPGVGGGHLHRHADRNWQDFGGSAGESTIENEKKMKKMENKKKWKKLSLSSLPPRRLHLP